MLGCRVMQSVHLQSHLFCNFSPDSLFQTFTYITKTCQGRIHSLGKGTLADKQASSSIRHQSDYHRCHLWIIDDVIGRAHTLAARHILLGGLPTSAAELMSIMPTEKSLRRGQQGGILHIQLKESLCQLNERPLEGCLYFSFL